MGFYLAKRKENVSGIELEIRSGSWWGSLWETSSEMLKAMLLGCLLETQMVTE